MRENNDMTIVVKVGDDFIDVENLAVKERLYKVQKGCKIDPSQFEGKNLEYDQRRGSSIASVEQYGKGPGFVNSKPSLASQRGGTKDPRLRQLYQQTPYSCIHADLNLQFMTAYALQAIKSDDSSSSRATYELQAQLCGEDNFTLGGTRSKKKRKAYQEKFSDILPEDLVPYLFRLRLIAMEQKPINGKRPKSEYIFPAFKNTYLEMRFFMDEANNILLVGIEIENDKDIIKNALTCAEGFNDENVLDGMLKAIDDYERRKRWKKYLSLILPFLCLAIMITVAIILPYLIPTTHMLGLIQKFCIAQIFVGSLIPFVIMIFPDLWGKNPPLAKRALIYTSLLAVASAPVFHLYSV